MISVISVYNDSEILGKRLLASLASQGAEHEFIGVDNRDSRFLSAAAALNWGAARARGGWLLFAHQDVALLTEDWLERAGRMLEEYRPRGWCGVVGNAPSGELRGLFLDRAALSGAPFDAPAEVQTLDECLLIHRRESDGYRYFDEGLAGWHAYGVEACCAAIRAGATNYVLPLPVWHDSRSTNLLGLEEAHLYVWRKHGGALGRICTTCGDLPEYYGWGGGHWADSLRRAGLRLQTSYYHRLGGHPGAFHRNKDEALESLTESHEVVECLHAPFWLDTIEARSFVPIPVQRRRVLHRFRGWEADGLESDCVVVAADLLAGGGDTFERLRELRGRARQLIVCADWGRAAPKGWRELRRQASQTLLASGWDGSRVAIAELRA